MLMLHNAREASREELARIPTPEGTDSWKPIPHATVVDALAAKARQRGLSISSERYALMPGSLGEGEGRIAVPEAKLFGAIDFQPISGVAFPPGCVPSAGLRNSHDKSFALSILSGARVLVCANGVLSAEHVVSRKHTSGIDLASAIDAALDAFMAGIGAFQATYEGLRSRSVSRREGHSLIVDMAQAGAFASCDILPIVCEWESPKHDDFSDRNAWSLYQACTEVMKKQSPARQLDGFRALNAVLVASLS